MTEHTEVHRASDRTEHAHKAATEAAHRLLEDSKPAGRVIDKLDGSAGVSRTVREGVTWDSFPNGVQLGRGGGVTRYLPADGGRTEMTEKGETILYDAHGKKAAKMDANHVFHVYDKNGKETYREAADGKVTKFSPQAKHSSGVVTPDKFGDYGVARGKDGRLQVNGVTFDSTGHNVRTSLRLTETQGYDKMGKPFVVAVDSENNKVYRQDSQGLHIFAGDGTFTVANGSVRFDRKDAGKAVPKAPELHDIRIVGNPSGDQRLSKR